MSLSPGCHLIACRAPTRHPARSTVEAMNGLHSTNANRDPFLERAGRQIQSHDRILRYAQIYARHDANKCTEAIQQGCRLIVAFALDFAFAFGVTGAEVKSSILGK
jgi:hypothetical protein